jgi:uncharacterized membrane-anchored protein
MRKNFAFALAALALCFSAPAFADGTGNAGPDVAAPPVRAAPQVAPVQQGATEAGRTGQIALMDGAVNLTVPQGYRFYSADVANAFVVRNGAAAPQGTVLGLIAPASVNVRDQGAWATVLSFDEIGYVQPETASGLTDTNFEADVRSARDAQGRVFEGFAVPAAFETATPSLAWAERSAAPGAGGKDFRHEQKMLGRRGVATLTSIGNADQMGAIAAAAPDMLSMLSFSEGNRHADFQPASDTVSAYTVPGLVTGVPQAQPQALADAAGTGQTSFGGLSGLFPWIAFGVVILAGIGYLAVRRGRRDDDDNLIPE